MLHTLTAIVDWYCSMFANRVIISFLARFSCCKLGKQRVFFQDICNLTRYVLQDDFSLYVLQVQTSLCTHAYPHLHTPANTHTHTHTCTHTHMHTHTVLCLNCLRLQRCSDHHWPLSPKQPQPVCNILLLQGRVSYVCANLCICIVSNDRS